jgi:enoyl-CoA hydratase/carnithine racemase
MTNAMGEVRCHFEESFEGRLAVVTIANPAKLNAMSRHMWQQVRSVFHSLQSNKNAGCIVIRGENITEIKSFSAGGDISEYPSFRFEEASLREFHEVDVWGGLQAMLDCDVPIVAQIEGVCMGAGLEIASCCDIRIAGSSAKFGAPIAKLGFPMAPKEAALVINAVGELTAREMLLEAAVFDATTMQQRGFLNRVVEDNDVQQSAMQSVNRILSLAPQATRLNKKTFREINNDIDGVFIAKSAIKNIAYNYASGAEHQEGISAFIAKRKPIWTQD